MNNAVKASLLIGAIAAQPVYAEIITDDYVGYKDHDYGDVIASSADRSRFDIQGASATLEDSFLSLTIETDFVNNIGIYPSASKNGRGIALGDLFLSSQWNPYGNPSDGYKDDYHANGTLWSYGLVLDNHYSTQGGDAFLYQLNGATNDDNAVLTNDVMSSGWTYRHGQETLVDTASGTVGLTDRLGSWAIDESNGLLTFGIDLAGTSLIDGNEIAFHWNMTCGNDTIEGAFDVPEPATLSLLGLSLAAMFGLRRRNHKDGESA